MGQLTGRVAPAAIQGFFLALAVLCDERADPATPLRINRHVDTMRADLRGFTAAGAASFGRPMDSVITPYGS